MARKRAETKRDPRKRDTRRRFEQWAHNPACQANTLSAVHGISMAAVAKREGEAPTMGQSPFAIARGQMFERSLFRSEARELRQALEEAGVLPAGAEGLADLRMRLHGGPMRDLDEARDATLELLRAMAKPSSTAHPTIIAAATLLIPSGVMLPEALLVIDVLAATYTKAGVTLTVGEIKTYPDRGGHTDTGELAGARAQAGVYVHALRMVVKELGLQERIAVSDHGFLVLSRPGFNRPSVRANEELRYQAWRAERGFGQLEAAAQELPPFRGDEDTEERLAAVMRAATAYEPACISFCDRARACHRAAVTGGDAVILGEEVARFLGRVPLARAMELMDGARPVDETERDLQRRLSAG